MGTTSRFPRPQRIGLQWLWRSGCREMYLRFLAVSFLLAMASAQTLSRYEIHRAASPISIDAKLDEPAWQKAAPARDFHFNRWTAGEKEPTVAKMLWDDENLYVGYY